MKELRTHVLDGRGRILCGSKGVIMTTRDKLATCRRCICESRKGVQLALKLT